MNGTLYLSTPVFNGAYFPSNPNINPGGEGVTFISTNASIAIDLGLSITPIVESVSIANKIITNVNQLHVIIIASNGSVIQTLNSSVGNTVVTGFPITPLPANSTLLITFETLGGNPPHSITLSIIACFHPELTTTGVSTTQVYSTTQSRLKDDS
jgi:hypothetical protein